MTAERFDLRDIAPQPWKNGAGLTREIARSDGSCGDAGGFDWRVSLAEVERDGPFSAFPGVDRCIVLMHGRGMRLRARDGSIDHRLTVLFEPFRFAGDVDLEATLVEGPSRDFNVMTRRGSFRSEVTCHREAASFVADDAAVTLLLCGAGEWRIGMADAPAAVPLLPMRGLVSRGPSAPLSLTPTGAFDDAAVLLVRLWHDSPA